MDLRASKQKQKPLVALSLPCLAKWAQLQRIILLIVALISPPRVLGKSLMLMESFAAHHAVSTYDDARQCSASGHVRALGPLVNLLQGDPQEHTTCEHPMPTFTQPHRDSHNARIVCVCRYSSSPCIWAGRVSAYANNACVCILHALIMHTMRHHHIQSIFSKPFVRAVYSCVCLLHPSK